MKRNLGILTRMSETLPSESLSHSWIYVLFYIFEGAAVYKEANSRYQIDEVSA